ncbi:FAD dependent oxidoreductase [Auricularia subglabra TFB-10046 SS5]|nr:FAD dependent oxidoreductase [Auricularia subglabra TFB-10046 SS5]
MLSHGACASSTRSRCPGINLAQSTLFLTVTRVLAACTISDPVDMRGVPLTPETVEYLSGIARWSVGRQIVVIGGGIIGCTTAYYITRHALFDAARDSLTVVEACDVAGGASGKAGGLVATWAYPRELVDISYAEHKRLADEHSGQSRWGYRVVGCGQWEGRGAAEHGEQMDDLHARSKGKRSRRTMPEDLDWIRGDLTESYVPFEGETAQVHPFQFTRSMLGLAQERGAKLLQDRVLHIATEGGRVTGVELASGTTLPASNVVLAAGPWSPRLLPALPITASRAHSITILPPAPVSAYCVFTEIALPDGRTAAPEIYARPDGEVYACFGSDSLPLPETSSEVAVDESKCDAIRDQVAAISPALAQGTTLVKQACYLPNVSSGGGPIIGDVPGTEGLIVGAGHTCWGICNGPGTGKALSELVMDGKIKCANLKKLHPSRFL